METADALDDSDDEVDYSKMDQVCFILIQIRHDVITETSHKIVIYHEVTIRKKSHQQHDNITINHAYFLPQQSILMNLSDFLWLILSKTQSQYNQDIYMINCD